jgi:hypothetical protein
LAVNVSSVRKNRVQPSTVRCSRALLRRVSRSSRAVGPNAATNDCDSRRLSSPSAGLSIENIR